ncbi:MAG: LPS assembly lipoprotein LptE [Campylobacterota bacterium]|nr:LPS assembly lipoprotein LptE [Campylobacterota bacterium]
MTNRILFFIFLSISIFSIIGCGYKPTTYYAKDEIKGKVFVDTPIDIFNTKNSILLRDAVNELLISKFNVTLVNNKSRADMLVSAKLNSVTHKGLETSIDGYTITYRAIVSINFSYKTNSVNSFHKKVTLSNYYDYSVDEDSSISDKNKLDAVKIATKKALSNIFSKIAINSMK